jgi:hypothetical protein
MKNAIASTLLARRRITLLSLVALIAGLLVTALPAMAEPADPATQQLSIEDIRTGSAPCGFPIRRDVRGTVEIASKIDEAGNLAISIVEVNLGGALVNPATGKAVELKWVRENGHVSLEEDGAGVTLALSLTGDFLRGYDIGSTDLPMHLPADGAPLVNGKPGQRSTDPWTHVCGLLAAG